MSTTPKQILALARHIERELRKSKAAPGPFKRAEFVSAADSFARGATAMLRSIEHPQEYCGVRTSPPPLDGRTVHGALGMAAKHATLAGERYSDSGRWSGDFDLFVAVKYLRVAATALRFEAEIAAEIQVYREIQRLELAEVMADASAATAVLPCRQAHHGEKTS